MTNGSCNPSPQCGSCSQNSLVKLGETMDKWDHLIALAGNPNTGKSTVFNALTGLRQHTGNWPGKTVSRAEGGYTYNDKQYKIVDLPGTYSLLSASVDEEIARDFILFGQPDVTIIVVDATRLERNLNLALQVMEITDRAVLLANLMDEAKRRGIEVNTNQLEDELGIPVVGAAARRGKGIDELLLKVSQVASGEITCNPKRIDSNSQELQAALNSLVEKIEEVYPGLPNARWVALRILEGDKRMMQALENGELNSIVEGTHKKDEAAAAI